MNMIIHPTAIVANGAKIAEGVNIGPYCIIGDGVTIHHGVKLHSHICIDGITTIGSNTEIYPFASIGKRPQDLKYDNEPSIVCIGENCVIREYVTIHPGTKNGSMQTVVGNNCLLMIAVHIAHDCKIGNNVILANSASLAGHVEVGDDCIVGGMSGIRQFVRIGKGSIVGGGSMLDSDVIPYGNVSGERAQLNGLNLVGLKRRNTPKEIMQELLGAFNYIFNSEEKSMQERLDETALNNKNNHMIEEIILFINESQGKAALCSPKKLKNNSGE
jgi:UDP-N-acetylglucosamine acyltransferase